MMADDRLHCESPGCSQTFAPQAYKARAAHQNQAHPELYPLSCPHQGCSKRFRTQDNLNSHLSDSHSPKNFPCDYKGCGKAFKNSRELKRHKDRVHLGDEGLSHYCPILSCDTAYVTKAQVPLHLRTFHADLYSYVCPINQCTAAYKNNQDTLKHIRSDHQGKQDCKVCGQGFDTYDLLNKHTNEQHSTYFPFGCSDCNTVFQSEALLHKHIVQCHKIEYPCGLCSSRFSTVSSLNQHIQAQHASAIEFACAKCSLVFKTDAEIQAHFTPDHQMPCTEPDCGEIAANAEELEEHYCEKHSDTLCIPCKNPGCTIAFPSKKLRALHLGRDEVHIEYKKCSKLGCSMRFETMNLLKQHEPKHTDSLPFLCNVPPCPAKYEKVVDLLEHEASEHARSRCEICSLTLSSGVNALAHCMVAHEGKVRCATCSKVFSGGKAMLYYKSHAEDYGLSLTENVVKLYGTPNDVTIEHMGVMSAEANLLSIDYEQAELVSADDLIDMIDEVEFEPLDTDQPQAIVSLKSPAGQHNIPRLQNFEDARLAAQERGIAVALEAERGLQNFVKHQRCRILQTEILKNTAGYDLAIRVTERVPASTHRAALNSSMDFLIYHFNQNDTVLKGLSSTLKELLERSPCTLSNLPQRDARWFFSAAQRLFLMQNPEHKLMIQEPSLRWDVSHSGIAYVVIDQDILGHDLRLQRTWRLQLRLSFKVDRSIDKVQLPTVPSHIEWTNTRIAHDAIPSEVSKELIDGVQVVARHLASSCMGWIGSRQQFSIYAELLKTRLLSEDDKIIQRQKQLIAQHWTTIELKAGLRLCHVSHLPDQSRVLIRPSDEISQHLMVTSLVARLEHVCAVLDKVLCGILTGLDIEQIWKQACAELDRQRDLLVEGTREPVTVCSQSRRHPPEELHVCPTCFRLRTCIDFTDEVLSLSFLVCKPCAANPLRIQAALPIKPADYTRGFIERNLKYLLQIEVGNVKSVISLAAIEEERKTIMKSLECYIHDDGNVSDNFSTQNLNSDVEARKTWSGPRRHPFRATIDAFLPVVLGLDKQPRYHTTGNISPMGFAANIGIGHYPKIHLYAIHLMAKEDEKAYKQGLALLRVCHANSYEMSTASAVQQTKRLSIKIDERFDSIQESLRTGKPLPRTIPPHVTLRTSMNSHKIRDDPMFKFDDQDYVYDQIECVAEQYDLESMHRDLWERQGVFFPYAVDSEVPDWTNQRLWNKIHEEQKRMRNICDRRSKNMADRPEFSKQELIIVLAHLWMRAVRRDLDAGIPPKMCGRDQMGLIPHPTIRMPLSGSVGHDNHRLAMISGLTGYNSKTRTQCQWNSNECNILWETQFCNRSKWDFDEAYYPSIFAIPASIRVGDYVKNSPESVRLPRRIPNFSLCSLLDTDSSAELLQSNYVDDTDQELLLDYYLYENDNFQNGQFVGHALDDDEELENCEDDICLIAENESLDTEATCQIIDTSLTQAQPQKKNLGRLTATCYISAPVQLLLALPEVCQALQLPGADREKHMRTTYGSNEEYVELLKLQSAISTVCDQLPGLGSRLPAELTKDILDASSTLKSDFVDKPSDAGEYYEFLLTQLDRLLSTLETGISGSSTSLTTFVLMLANRAMNGLPQHVLRDDIATYLLCHSKSGFNSPIAKNHLLHFVREYNCQKCQTCVREFLSAWTIKVNHHDGGNSALGSFSAESVKDEFLKEQADQKFEARCLNKSCHTDQDTFGEPVIRIINAPLFLTVQTNRVGYVSVPGGIKETLNTDRWTDGDTFDLASWKMDTGMPSETTADEDFILKGQTNYRRIGVLAFKNDFLHWVSYVKEGNHNDQDWVEFDDLEPHPRYQDPEKITDTRFCEGLILYRREDAINKEDLSSTVPVQSPGTPAHPAMSEVSTTKTTDQIIGGVSSKLYNTPKPSPSILPPIRTNLAQDKSPPPQLISPQFTSQPSNHLTTMLDTMKTMPADDLRALRKFASTRLSTLTSEDRYWDDVYDDDVEPRQQGGSINAGIKKFFDRFTQGMQARVQSSSASPSSASTKRDISHVYGQDQPQDQPGSDRPLKQRGTVKSPSGVLSNVPIKSPVITIIEPDSKREALSDIEEEANPLVTSAKPRLSQSPLSHSYSHDPAVTNTTKATPSGKQPVQSTDRKPTTPTPDDPAQKSLIVPQSKALRENLISKQLPRHMLPTASSLGKRSGAMTGAVLGSGSGNGSSVDLVARGIANVKRVKRGVSTLKSAFKIPSKKGKGDDEGEKKK